MGRIGLLSRCIGVLFVAGLILSSCKDEPKSISPAQVVVPLFNADSAYAHIEKQISFGPRVPGTEGQIACRDWMVSKLKSYGAKVSIQEFEAKIFDGSMVPGYNIMAQYNAKKKKRVLLAAHWDTRKVADKDTVRKNEPIDGADDGASGTAALIEIARLLQQENINMGVDILLFDVEDQGSIDGEEATFNSWTLGSEYWSKNLLPKGYKAENGILLDMIAAKGAIFGREYYSSQHAKYYQDKIWSWAKKTGKGQLFANYDSGGIADDHLNVINAGIPMVDIINRPMKTRSGFGHYHHTHKDDISIIDKNILGSVGQLVTLVIYRDAAGQL